jgi:2-polyprenyl-6-methoxyphenol hydroxylase-like FAD-dependent oxidoreductase
VTRTALIVGAGIGGLSAGIALRQAGWRVRIFERAASPRELGFGLLIAPSAFAALRDLGVADVVMARGFRPARGELRRLDGRVLKRGELPAPDVLGGPSVMALRPALHGALLEAFGLDGIALASEASGFDLAGNRVTLRMADGRSETGDLLVGADGTGSVVRRVLHPSEPPPRRAGIVAVRGASHGALHHLDGLSGVYYVGRGVEAAAVRASETGIYWFLSVAEMLLPASMRDPAAIVAHMWPRLDGTLRAMAAAAAEMRCDDLVDRDPIDTWGRGVVTLLGDAAHPVLPHTGQGAAQAIVDAVTLGRALGARADVEGALRSYEHERRQKTAALLLQGRRTAWVMKTTNPVAVFARDTAVRLIPIGPIVKLLARINRRAGAEVGR